MKKKKNNITAEPPELDENLTQWQKSFLLGKRKAAKEREKMTREQRLQAVFEEKIETASQKKAPVTLRTKGYYRFCKDYPSNVDSNGFRENNPVNKKSSIRILIITIICCIAVFCVAYTGAKTGLNIAELTSAEQLSENAVTAEQFDLRAYHFSYNELASGDAESIKNILKLNNCNTAVFGFKDDYGYVIFNTGAFIGASADKRIASAAATVAEIKKSGYNVCAYISCFKDTVAPQADLSLAVRANTSEGANWLDNSQCGWLNPYSSAAVSYVLGLVEAADGMGFSHILLNNVAFSADSGNAAAFYPGEADSSSSRNTVLKSFVNSAAAKAKNAKIIVMCSYQAFDNTASDTLACYYGNMFGTNAGSVCVDARGSNQNKNITIGSESFANATDMPYVFVLAASEFLCDNLYDYIQENSSNTNAIICIEKTESTDEQLSAIGFSDANGYIIW